MSVPLGKLRQKVQATETDDSLTLSRQLTYKSDIPALVPCLDASLFQSGGYPFGLRDDCLAAGGIAVEIVGRQAASPADSGEKLYGSICPPRCHKKILVIRTDNEKELMASAGLAIMLPSSSIPARTGHWSCKTYRGSG
ncbi:hypothetical protein FOH24_06680 [Acetobacter tropicalis]|uniref:hypothetical protein n=1 Tax=Acetobacter tropicalis TaxID=104102 RepID=UPI00123A2819|nr:hypothetical protein [Acetobacter tropicalis]KAA8391311.1 hypothetical protein FOH22_00200 [Acetobacter tropicalis]KAA8391565.1 hypothetical protein FOH24_06680 [Acetobacter tropicalis]MBC9007841.1 hypothetical protein [Acetobacter tropicalis]